MFGRLGHDPPCVENLRAEGIPKERIFLVGNVMIDTLLRFRDQAGKSNVLQRLGIDTRRYAVVTLHRPSNVDDASQLAALISTLQKVTDRLPVVFPVHPRTRQRLEENGLSDGSVQLVPPLGYFDFLCLESNARLILTDSGGIQEEATVLGVPCLTLRSNTERPITLKEGTNRLVGTSPAQILQAVGEELGRPYPRARSPAFWDGQAAERIADHLERLLRRSVDCAGSDPTEL